MTGFFEQQERARRTTRVLMLLMGLSVVAMAAAIYVVLLWLASFGQGSATFRPGTGVAVLIGTSLVVLAASGTRMLSLRGGGAQIAEMMGGRLVSGNPRDVLEKRLLNVVEEMAIASGVPVPQVFVLEAESGINAFAAGLTLEDAALSVTRGCLEKLTRDELQGVIAHEFSHVLNGDMRLNIRLMGIVFGIVCIGLFGRILMRFGTSSSRWGERERRSSGFPVLMFGLAVLVIGSIGEFFGKLIKAAVSRQREYLADASAVQFTRNPEGIAGALKKIGGFSAGGRVGVARAEEASHFFFADIHTFSFALPWFATHPPLADRITRIDPSFEGQFPAVAPGIAQPDDAPVAGFAPHALAPERVVERVGAPDAGSVACARTLLDGIPNALKVAVATPFSASAAVYALLLSDTPRIADAQRERIDTIAGPALGLETAKLAPMVHALPRRERLPFAELLAPALRALTREQRAAFSETIARMIDADDSVSIFEYVLSHTLADRLADSRGLRAGARHRSFQAVRDELALLLSLLAHAGAYQADAAAPAFERGVSRLIGVQLSLLPASPRLLSGLSEALDELRALVPELSEQVVDACAHVVIADQRMAEDEFTLLRVVCAALHCPLPPVPGLVSSRPPPGASEGA